MQIVSANYLNRNSPDRWLVRDASQDPRTSVAYRSVIATNVQFCRASDFERGFGCSIVGQCAEAIGGSDVQEPLPGAVPLHFEFNNFVTDGGAVVRQVEKLQLMPDGTMYAVVIAQQSAERYPWCQHEQCVCYAYDKAHGTVQTEPPLVAILGVSLSVGRRRDPNNNNGKQTPA